MKNSFWQLIISEAYGRTYRGRVPGGWLVKYYFNAGKESASSLEFVPDGTGSWEVLETCDWEKVQNGKTPNHTFKTYRLEVPCGWLVRDGYRAANLNLSLHMACISDPKHTWRP